MLQHNDKYLARRATVVAYSQRYAGPMPDYGFRYEGGFDFQKLVDSIPVSETGILGDHKTCWRQLFQKFDEEYRLFEKKHGGISCD